MEQTEQKPAHFSLPHAFTLANAKDMAAKSVLTRQIKKAKREQQRVQASLPNAICEQAALLWEAMQNIAKRMTQAKSAELLVELANAHTKLRADWQVLTGTPNPGSRRVKSERLRGISAEPIPEPSPATIPNQPPKVEQSENPPPVQS